MEIGIIVLLIGIICILGYYSIIRLINKDKPTKIFGYYIFEVSSYSMYNEESIYSLNKGDLIFVKSLKDESYEVGMVITYLQDNSNIPVTHMIVKREGNRITTRGINTEGNTSDDIPFDVSQILGEVKGVWRNYNSFISWITSPIGFVCVILIGFLVVEGSYFIHKSLYKKETSKIEKKCERKGVEDEIYK